MGGGGSKGDTSSLDYRSYHNHCHIGLQQPHFEQKRLNCGL